jgi:hypothetical protein
VVGRLQEAPEWPFEKADGFAIFCWLRIEPMHGGLAEPRGTPEKDRVLSVLTNAVACIGASTQYDHHQSTVAVPPNPSKAQPRVVSCDPSRVPNCMRCVALYVVCCRCGKMQSFC